MTEPRMEVVKPPDAFENNPKLNDFFTSMVDYLSLWHWLYGLDYADIRVGPIVWLRNDTFAFKLWHARDSKPISMTRYDPRLPDVAGVYKGRLFRMRGFIMGNQWFRRLLWHTEHHVNDWARANEVTPASMDATTRWCSNGCIVIKLIDKRGPMNHKTHMTHYKYD